MFPQAQFYVSITLENDEPLFGYTKGHQVKVNFFDQPKSSDLCLVTDENNQYTVRRYEVIDGKISLWPPVKGKIAGKIVFEESNCLSA